MRVTYQQKHVAVALVSLHFPVHVHHRNAMLALDLAKDKLRIPASLSYHLLQLR